jgi:hypothetical protein
MSANQPAVRIVPGKGSALYYTVFAVILLVFINIGAGTVTVNGHVVTGAERTSVLNGMRLIFDPIIILVLVWSGRRLWPGSPLDFLELGPDGLTVGTLFGRRYRRWEEISGFSVGSIPLTNPPIVWITTEGERPLRFFMSGYIRFRFFSWTSTRVREIADWLDTVRRVYAFGSGDLPPPPDALAGTIIPSIGMTRPSSTSVIERRSRS